MWTDEENHPKLREIRGMEKCGSSPIFPSVGKSWEIMD